MPFVRYMWGHFASGAEMKKKMGPREHGDLTRGCGGARCGGSVVSAWPGTAVPAP